MMLYRKNCLNCYFCTKVYDRHPFSLTQDDRIKAKKSDYSFLNAGIERNIYSLECAKGQWSEGMPYPNLRQSLNKKTCCHFYNFKKGNGKSFPSIEDELRLGREIRTENRAVTSLLFSGAALAVSILALVVSTLKISPETIQILSGLVRNTPQ